MTPEKLNAQVNKTIEGLRAELRVEGLPDDDSTCLRLAVLKLNHEQRTGFHHNGRAHTAKVRG